MTTPEQIAGLTELENLVTQLEAWEGMISAGYQCPAAGISMHNAAKHLADIAHKLRTGKLIVVDHPQATSPVDEPINATDAAFMAGEAIYQRDGVSPFLREVMQLKRDNDAKPGLAAKDAARYRWLRDHSCPPHNFYISVPDEFHGVRYAPSEVDAYIDAARQALGDEACPTA